MRWRTLVACAVVAAATVGSVAVMGQDQETSSVPAAAGEESSLWFVELASPPTADGTSLSQVRTEKDDFRRAARAAGLRFEERLAFDRLWNGLSLRVDPSQVDTLARVAGVRAVYPVAVVSAPEVQPADTPDLAFALAMTGADTAQEELGLTGEGIKVAVMDTGIDYHHPDLGGCFGPGCRVIAGHDFVGDAFNADPTSPTFNPVAVPDLDPDDCNGHGTHVAGIVGASGDSIGVAPGATFGAYRVFGCTGSTTADIMIAAMERALADGMQVLNMSIGSTFQWPQYPTAQASDRLVNKGVVVVASAGNSGPSGLYSLGAPSVGQKVISVASFDNSHVRLASFTVAPDDTTIGYAPATAAPAPPTSGTQPMARTGTASSTNDACGPLPAASLAGKVALIRRGTCTFHQKSLNAQNAGAVAVVLYNNSTGRFSATVAGSPAITIPVVSISAAEGLLINNRLASGAVSMTWTAETVVAPNATGNTISSFSSYGLSPDLALKPDIGAPGGLIRAPYPLERGGYATLSGTSMSAPHVAGGVALLLQARPNTPSQAVRGILQASADPRPWWNNPGLGFLDNVHRQGAGMLDIPGAVLSTTKVEPSKLSLGESQTGPATRTLTITNDGPADITYALTHQPALSTGASTFTPSFVTNFASVAFDSSSITVPSGGSASVQVTITANQSLVDRGQYGGYLVLTPQSGAAPVRVPYAGFKGDYQAIPVLVPTGSNFPWLARRSDASFSRQSDGAVFTLQDGDIPYVLVHLDHQSRRLRVEVTDAVSGHSWHRAMELSYVGRNSAATSFFSLPWDGTTTSGNKTYSVPNGQYRLTLTVQKALGSDTEPAHHETWTSPVFTVNRPATPTP